MGRRFGRNQKRQMRAEIAMHANEADHLLDVVNYRDRQINDLQRALYQREIEVQQLQRVISDAHEVLGEYWVGLPPQTYGVDRLPRADDVVRFPVLPKIGDIIRRPMPEKFDAKIRNLHMLVMRGHVDVDDLRAAAHVVFRTPGGDVAYGFTRQAFMRNPKAYTEKVIAKQMAEYLLRNETFQEIIGRGR